jgi:two-component system, OmpR family, KDP operon response regulator KdpE
MRKAAGKRGPLIFPNPALLIPYGILVRNSSNFVSARAKGPRGMKYNTLLLVDDEPQIRRVLQTSLAQAGYGVILAKNGQEGIDTVVREHPDLVLLDMNLPDMSGFDACKMIRVSFAGPILMVSVRDSVRDKIDALDAGADDYIVKPFATGELLARVRAALRRTDAEQPLPRIETSELTVDLEMRMVNVRGDRVHLTPKEFDVLRLLVIQQGRPVTHRKILQIVWGPEYREETELVRVVVKDIRKKIEKDPAHPRYIVTEPGIGYMFQLPLRTVEKRPPREV